MDPTLTSLVTYFDFDPTDHPQLFDRTIHSVVGSASGTISATNSLLDAEDGIQTEALIVGDSGTWQLQQPLCLRLKTGVSVITTVPGYISFTVEFSRADPTAEQSIKEYILYFATATGEKIASIDSVPVWTLKPIQNWIPLEVPMTRIPSGASRIMIVSSNSAGELSGGPSIEISAHFSSAGASINADEDDMNGIDSFSVKLMNKTQSHIWKGMGADVSFSVNGVESPQIFLVRYHRYKFYLSSDADLYFSTSMSGGGDSPLTDDIEDHSDEPIPYILFFPSQSTPSRMFYQHKTLTFIGGVIYVRDPNTAGSILRNGWKPLSSPVAYFKRNGMVWLHGSMYGGTVGAGAFQLPLEFRPAHTHTHIAASDFSMLTEFPITVTVDTDGWITVASPSNTSSVSLDGFHFPAAEYPANLIGDFPQDGTRVSFDSTTAIDWATQLRANGMTVELWVFLYSETANKSLISVVQNESSTQHTHGWRLGVGTNRTFSFSLSSEFTQKISTIEGGVWVPRTWYHIAGTYNGREMSLFVDGVTVATSTAEFGSIVYRSNSSTFQPVACLLSCSGSLVGPAVRMENIALFGSALSSVTIKEHSTRISFLTDLSAIALFEFQDSDTTQVTDTSARKHHGVVTTGTRRIGVYDYQMFSDILTEEDSVTPHSSVRLYVEDSSQIHFFEGAVEIPSSCSNGCSLFTIDQLPYPPPYPYRANFVPPNATIVQINSLDQSVYHIQVDLEGSATVSAGIPLQFSTHEKAFFGRLTLLPATDDYLTGTTTVALLDDSDYSDLELNVVWGTVNNDGITCLAGRIYSPTRTVTKSGITTIELASISDSLSSPPQLVNHITACQISGSLTWCHVIVDSDGSVVTVWRDIGSIDWISLDGICFGGWHVDAEVSLFGSSMEMTGGSKTLLGVSVASGI
eukprot:c7237_g1_i1.p1 GENE.c7237_g1_i1~~c7237_g1_i1.p1  ORF type:complete len:915 (-),score=262.51 c7237_g1_i1:34-2778(-)